MPPTASARSTNPGLAASSRSASAARDIVWPQSRQTTCERVPCRFITVRLPALVCSRSTFWVITPDTTPARSKFGQRAVTGVGQRLIHVPPADVIARPVPLPKRLVRK